MAQLSAFVNRVLLERSHTYSFSLVRGCFCTAKADLNLKTRTVYPTKPNILTSLLTPGLKYASELSHPRGKETGVSIPGLLTLQG